MWVNTLYCRNQVPLLRSLHWLPVRFRILCKINLLTYKTLFIFTPCLPHHFHPTHWDQTMIIVCQSLGQDQHRWKTFSLLCLISLEQLLAVCPLSRFSGYLQERSQDTSLWLGLSPMDTGMPDGLLLWNCFFDFAVERLPHHWIWLCWGYWHYRFN